MPTTYTDRLQGSTSEEAVFTGRVRGVAGSRISNKFIGQNTYKLLETLKITTGRFDGAWRYRHVGIIQWYFVLSAMVLGRNYFTVSERQECVVTAIDKGVVGPRANSGTYGQYAFVTFPSRKIYFCNIAGTSAGAAPSDASINTAGQFLGDGTITWEYTGLTAPLTWQWFMLDIGQDLLTPLWPDSTDAYAGMIAAAAYEADVDAGWLATASAHNGLTRLQVIDLLMQNCCTDELNGVSPGPRLSNTFQNGTKGTGETYGFRFLADNVEVWRGYEAQAALQIIAGASSAAATQNAADVRAGVLALFVEGRFQTYEGQDVATPTHLQIAGNDRFVTDFRFHLWPALHGMLVTLEEWQTYADGVGDYIEANVSGLFSEELDAFPISEAFVVMADDLHWEEAHDTLFWRVTSREIEFVTIVDAVLAIRRTIAAETTGAAIADGDKGDITTSGSGAIWTIDNGAVTLAKMANMATDSLVGRDTAGTGDPEAITVTGGIEFSGAGSLRTSAFTGDVTKAAGGTAQTIAANAVDNTKAADMATNTVKGNATGATADPADIAVGTNTVLGRVAGNIVAAQVVTGQIADDAVTNAKLANVATSTIKGRSTAGTGDPEDLTGTQATALLDTFTSGAKGLVPASGGGTTNFLRADGTFAAPPGGGGGGATGGTATLDFGAAPGSSLAAIVVTGQASIGTGSRIRAWVQGSTADHNAYEHSRILPGRLGIGTADIVAGVGFTICAETELRLTGQVAVNWEWA